MTFMKIHPFLKPLFIGIWTISPFLLNANPIKVLPIQSENRIQSLNGDWEFKYVSSQEAGGDSSFYELGFDSSSWSEIKVPSCWEMQGFSTPGYDKKDLADGLGLYRRDFCLPENWLDGDGDRVCIRFEGVAYGFEIWINGVKMGASSASAYNPHTFDITEALNPDPSSDNLLAVKATTRAFGYEFDTNDDWSFSGIFRDVTLFTIPRTHIQDFSTDTKLSSLGEAQLDIHVKVNQPGATINGILLNPSGSEVCKFVMEEQKDAFQHATVIVSKPLLWNAENPDLYRMQLELSHPDNSHQIIERRIGLRELSIRDGILLLNGGPFKLRGVNHHDISPVHGRSVTEAEIREDLELMRKANINHIRTSHYPPHPMLLDLCDELGFYVMNEVPVGRGDEHLQNPEYQNNLLNRAESTVLRDKNHACMIIWGIGNEDPWSELLLKTAHFAHELDPTRPVCFPQTPSTFNETWGNQPDFLEVFSPHYPTNEELIDHANTLDRPTIYSEYVHAWGLGLDKLETQWEVIQATPHLAGAAIWHFHDQGILRCVEEIQEDYNQPAGSVWLDEKHYYDTGKSGGCDGIVYADRTPQTNYYQTRKVYSPIQIEFLKATVNYGTQLVPVVLENRYDFRSLHGVKLIWTLKRNREAIKDGSINLVANPHEVQTLHIPVTIPDKANMEVFALELKCVDETGLQITERSVELKLNNSRRNTWVRELDPQSAAKWYDKESVIQIESDQWTLTLDKTTGNLAIHDSEKHEIVSGLYPHTGRKLNLNDQRAAAGVKRDKPVDFWPVILTRIESPDVQITQLGSSIYLQVSGRYPREDKTEKCLTGGYTAEITSSGTIHVQYHFLPNTKEGVLLEAGMSILVPDSMNEFRWIGKGPYNAYPGKEKLSEFGIFHLNRRDLYFQGNRRSVELAMLTNRTGNGVALSTQSSDVAVERLEDYTLLSHNALLSGLGNKGWLAETTVDLANEPFITGRFSIVPLSPRWPTILTDWFGDADEVTNVFAPYYHSFDQ